ncbi:transcription factor GTE6-like [Prunus yedoensis var. nudiflora]|uniref:Transcription factor GTE6-like n=1 Tax=Prunus yedoensis var. nudiflora TaxID=2094558 RepID=A0A314ZB21_PRUYE|nr:transcription factor GTE6-like [Prunus yedoensis var. nudiflora]
MLQLTYHILLHLRRHCNHLCLNLHRPTTRLQFLLQHLRIRATSIAATSDGDGAKNSSGGMSPTKKAEIILSDLGYLWRSGCSFFLKLLKRKISTEEKRKLGVALTRLSPEDLSKALDIVAQNNPGFQATADEVDLDIDAQVIIFIIDQLGLIHTNAR